MKFSLKVEGARELKDNFGRLTTVIPRDTAYKGTVASGIVLEGIARGYIGGQPTDSFQAQAANEKGNAPLGEPSLKTHSGMGGLKGSIGHMVGEENQQIGAAIGTNIVYGRIHELGGPLGKTRHIKKTGKIVNVKGTMPARPYLYAALLAGKEAVLKLFKDAFWEETKNGLSK